MVAGQNVGFHWLHLTLILGETQQLWASTGYLPLFNPTYYLVPTLSVGTSER